MVGVLVVAAAGAGPRGGRAVGGADEEAGRAEGETVSTDFDVMWRRAEHRSGRMMHAQQVTQAAKPEFVPYWRWRSSFGGMPAPADVERVCQWRRSLIAAAIVLEMAAESEVDHGKLPGE